MVDSLIVFILPVVDDGLNREPGKHWLPPGQQQSVPQSSDSPIAVGKGMNQFQLVMEYTAFDEHMEIAVPHPVQQLHD